MGNNNVVYDSRDDCNAIIETATDKLIVGSSTTIIPNSILSIGDAAFYRCTGLTSINIPNSVISIGFSAFSQCGCLTSIVVSPNNKVYDSRDNCNAIIETATNTLMFGCNTTIIPSTITSIGSFAFSGCSGIISMEIPSSVRSIGGYAFDGMSKLETLYILNPDANVAADSRALHNKNHYCPVKIDKSSLK